MISPLNSTLRVRYLALVKAFSNKLSEGLVIVTISSLNTYLRSRSLVFGDM